MIGISTHVLDTARGQPARGIRVVLERRVTDASWTVVGEGVTDSSGRIPQLLAGDERLQEGAYRMIFQVEDYFAGQDHFYPQIAVQFLVHDPLTHYHIPLLLSPYGYSTYRGS